jgi:EAL domain-containing protein (putative c-di-GMP-specific phosphodiesterase class I)
MPDEFIPIVQQTGLIMPLALYVIDEALRQTRAWLNEGLRLAIAVNLSTRNLLDLDFPEQVERVLEKWEVHPGLLVLEITESTMLVDPARTKQILERLSEMGIRLSIDDFGTGYSSLSYLKRFPVNTLKIDRTFVSGLGTDPDDTSIVTAIVALGRALGLRLHAEGVENDRQRQAVREIGCELAQGYHWSPPLPPEDVEPWLRRRSFGVVPAQRGARMAAAR